MSIKKTLVMGASLKPQRYSNRAIYKLVEKHHDVVAFGLNEGEVAGVKIDTAPLHYEDIHTITIYLNPKRQVQYYEYIVSLKPKRIIFNPGTENQEFYLILEKNHIQFEEACTLVLLSIGKY